MFRTARRIAPLFRSLVMGTATFAGVSLVAGSLVGCGDESDPLTHVKKMQDAATRPQAVNRLIQFFEDGMTRDNKDRNGPTVKPLLDKIVEPMTQTCVGGDVDDRTNSKLIKFLSDARDPRGEPCLVKALKDYKVDSTEEDVRWACRAVGAMKLKSAAGPLMEVFSKLHASKPKAAVAYRDVHDAMVELLDPSWKPQLIAHLGHPTDPKNLAAYKDELFWQITSAEILGLMKAADAIKPLMKVALSPSKADAHMTAVLAMVKIGKPTIAPATALLKGDDKDLVDYSKAEQLKAAGEKATDAQKKAADVAYVGTAALVLATIGRQETAAPLMDALGRADDVSRAILGREITKLPKTDETISAFKEAFEKTPVSLSIPPGIGGRETLLEASGLFFDSSLVPWYVSTAKKAKGDEENLQPIREASLNAAMKLMTPDQTSTVDELAKYKAQVDGKPSTLGKGFEKELKLSKELLDACGEKPDCYLQKLVEPASQAQETQFRGIKCAYMIGSLGKPEHRQKILDAMPKLTNAAVRFVSVSVIDSLSPKGDTAIAAKLQKIVDEGEAQKDPNKIALNAPFKTVIYRLNARAQ